MAATAEEFSDSVCIEVCRNFYRARGKVALSSVAVSLSAYRGRRCWNNISSCGSSSSSSRSSGSSSSNSSSSSSSSSSSNGSLAATAEDLSDEWQE